jgi:hypothetical protein
MMHQEAWKRNFFGVDRRVFPGDATPANLTTERWHFSMFTPNLDLMHTLRYTSAARFTGRPQTDV